MAESVFVAKLDKNGIYQGVVKKAKLKKGDVEVPEHCDLAKGCYCWHTGENTFKPTEEFIEAELKKKVFQFQSKHKRN